MSLFIPAPTECGPPPVPPAPAQLLGSLGCPWVPAANPAPQCQTRCSSRERRREQDPHSAASTHPAHTPWKPCLHPIARCCPPLLPRPPSRPPGTHSFSRARSPKKEPFSSTVILLLLSSLWEKQRERGSSVTQPAGQPHPCPGDLRGAGGGAGMARPAARSGSPGCAAGVVAMVKSQGQACTADCGHGMQRPCWDAVP